jgi:hypothetical protein
VAQFDDMDRMRPMATVTQSFFIFLLPLPDDKIAIVVRDKPMCQPAAKGSP